MYAKKIKFGILMHVIVSIEYLKYYAYMKKKKKKKKIIHEIHVMKL